MKKGINLFRVFVALLAVLSVFMVSSDKVFASGKAETFAHTEKNIAIVDENGEVMAIFTPCSPSEARKNRLLRTGVNVNCSLGGYTSGYLANIYTLNDGHNISLNITINPQASSNIGLYNHDTGSYGWPAGGLSSSGWYGTLTVSGKGRYSLAFKNNSSTSTNYSGSYSF